MVKRSMCKGEDLCSRTHIKDGDDSMYLQSQC